MIPARVLTPTVTQVMRVQGLLPAPPPFRTVAGALRRGTAVHKACELDDHGVLDEQSVAPQLQPYLTAHRRAKLDLGIEDHIAIEQRLEHPLLKFRGRPDWIGWVKGRRFVIDWKSGNTTPDPATVIQLAAYAELVRVWLKLTDVPQIMSLHYRSDGTYRSEFYTSKLQAWGWTQFHCALVNYQWRREHGRLTEGG